MQRSFLAVVVRPSMLTRDFVLCHFQARWCGTRHAASKPQLVTGPAKEAGTKIRQGERLCVGDSDKTGTCTMCGGLRCSSVIVRILYWEVTM